MPPHDIALEVNEYRLVLARSGSQALWAENSGGMFRLPRISIPRWARPAERLQQAIEEVWRLRSVVLDLLASEKCSNPCAVVEILSSSSLHGLTACMIDDISAAEISSEEREAVEGILAGRIDGRGPFSRVGWVQEAIEWISVEAGHDIEFTGEIHQFNASGSFALVRFVTQAGPAYWLKATGEPNTHEFQITRMLAEMCSAFLPRRISGREDWNAWVMEGGGEPLEHWNLGALEQAVLTLARLQKRTVNRTGAFLDAGAFDQRVCVLRAHLGELFDYLDEAMAKQTSKRVPRIEESRLSEMANVLHDACLSMEALEIPDTVVHNDMNSGNILFDTTHCVFTDWCEAGISNPFFAFQYLCLLDPCNGLGCRGRLREIYKQAWLDHLSGSKIDRAFAIAPLLAILSYLYGRGTWLQSERRNHPSVQSYARSLARHIDRAAQDKNLLEALCH
jgi:hypothetical protein